MTTSSFPTSTASVKKSHTTWQTQKLSSIRPSHPSATDAQPLNYYDSRKGCSTAAPIITTSRPSISYQRSAPSHEDVKNLHHPQYYDNLGMLLTNENRTPREKPPMQRPIFNVKGERIDRKETRQKSMIQESRQSADMEPTESNSSAPIAISGNKNSGRKIGGEKGTVGRRMTLDKSVMAMSSPEIVPELQHVSGKARNILCFDIEVSPGNGVRLVLQKVRIQGSLHVALAVS
jgi:hypothetical protein